MMITFFFFYNQGYLPALLSPRDFGLECNGHSILDGQKLIMKDTAIITIMDDFFPTVKFLLDYDSINWCVELGT